MWNNVFNGTKAEALPEKESAAAKEMIFLRLNEYRKKVDDTICGKTKQKQKSVKLSLSENQNKQSDRTSGPVLGKSKWNISLKHPIFKEN